MAPVGGSAIGNFRLSSLAEVVNPRGSRFRQFRQNVRFRFSRPFRDVERMVCAVDDMKCSSCSEFCNDRPQQFQIGKSVTSSLKKEHWQTYLCEVVRSLGSRPVRRVQGKTEKHE